MASFRKHPESIIAVARRLSRVSGRLQFGRSVSHVYNPLDYAWERHAEYLERYAVPTGKEVILLGMNPGPWGMAQTGVPFGEVELVREWLGTQGPVGRPSREHPQRPVLGFLCPRSEVSGRRLWGWARNRFGPPESFFRRFFVANYCPLMFLEASGRNRTPDRLPASLRAPLLEACDRALRRTVEILEPKHVIGIGRFAESRARSALRRMPVQIGGILHPSPANPAANRDWRARAEEQLTALGVEV